MRQPVIAFRGTVWVLALGLGLVACGEDELATSQIVQGSFDWGGDCDSGNGEFSQAIAYQATVDVGQIPAGKRDVVINLASVEDVDIQLVDEATGHQIVAWPYGDLNGAGEGTTQYQGVTYKYSGYNGVDGERGHEFIEVLGDTNRPLIMRAFGYAAGDADVTYSWQAVPTCREKGRGEFDQYVPYRELVAVGSIPVGKTNIRVELEADYGRDIDIQLVHDSDGHEIIAWPDGDLATPGPSQTVYKGMTIDYSGYNGKNGNLGWEEITITGATTTELTMRAYGYAAGDAHVDYEWGVGVGESCEGGTIQPPLPPCSEGLTCKRETLSLSAPGVCHTDDWCLADGMAFYQCGDLEEPGTPGEWTCKQFQCSWREYESQCESSGGTCTMFTCPEGTYSDGPLGCSGKCCLPLGGEIVLGVSDDGDTLEAKPGDQLVLRLDRGEVVACEGGEWLESSIYNPNGMHLLAHNIIPDEACPGLGCYGEMDEYRFLVIDTGSDVVDFAIDQGPAPEWCDNTLRGTFSIQLLLP